MSITLPNEAQLNDKLLTVLKAQLKAPLTAVLCKNEEMQISKVSENTYSIEGYVNSQNSYGAFISTDFKVSASFINGQWSVSNPVVGEKNAKEYAKNFAVNYIAISIFVAVMALIGTFLLKAIVGY